MSHWNRWSRRKRILLTAAAVVILTMSTWAAFSSREAFGQESESAGLKAPVPPPEEVYIQQRDNADGLGNVYILVQLSNTQVAAKLREGTADFLTIGTPENLVILRDDGRGGDTTAGDRLYTGIAGIDPAALQLRAREDEAEYDSQSSKLVPIFEGRTVVGVEEPVPFDYAAFAAGQVVRFGPAVAFLEPETLSPSQEEGTPVEAGALSSSESEGSPRLITAGISSPTPVSPSVNAFQKRVLMITNTNVVTDPARTWDPCTNTGTPNGVWTFNHLMTQMTGTSGIPPSAFVLNWLQTWTNPNTINQDPLPARTRMNKIINQWPTVNGNLDLTQSPLRLLAIVPRLDLRRTTGGGGGSYQPSSSGNFEDAGELRFIFGFVAKKTTSFDPAQEFLGAAQIGTSTCYALPFTVIFEYRVPKTECLDVKAWAQGWRALRNQPLWGPYRTHLESLTQQVVLANPNFDTPNNSALGQLRTNEVALDAPWELREFRLQQPASFLVPSTVEDTIRNDPASDYNNGSNGPLFRQYVQTVVEPLLPPFEGPIPAIPLFYQGQAFKGGDSRVNELNPALITFHWNDPNLNVVTNLPENWARHRVSRASCNGCHRREVFTHFVHVNPADTIPGSNPALPAELSVFLTGINGLGDPANAAANLLSVSNPNNGNPKRNFDDLARREKDLKAVAKMSCSGMPKANSAHVNSHFRATGQLPDNLFEGMPRGQQLSVAIDDILRNFIFEVH